MRLMQLLKLFAMTTFVLGTAANHSQAENPTSLADVQKVITAVDLRDTDSKPIQLAGLTATKLIRILHQKHRRKGYDGGYHVQVDDQGAVSVYYDGDYAGRGAQTFIRGQWDRSHDDPIPGRTLRLEQSLFDSLLPELGRGKIPAVENNLEDYHLHGFELSGSFADTEREYLRQFPDDSQLVTKIKLLGDLIETAKKDGATLRDELGRADHRIYQLGTLADNEELREQIRDISRKITQQNAPLQSISIALLKARVAAESERSSLLKSIHTAEMKSACEHYPQKGIAASNKLAQLKQLTSQSNPQHARYYHLAMEQSRYIFNRSERTKAIDQAIQAAERQFSVPNPESIHLGVIVWKSMKQETDWNRHEKAERLALGIMAMEHALSVYSYSNIGPIRRADVHKVLGELIEEYEYKSSGIADQIGLQQRLGRAAFHLKRADELRTRKPRAN